MPATKTKKIHKRNDIVKFVCPNHEVRLIPQKTRWGMMLKCLIPGCTVVCWAGSTSTPADSQTRTARKLAHSLLDPLWRTGKMSRGNCYKRLSEYMGIKRSKAHIGMFSESQCSMVIDFCISMNEEISTGVPAVFPVSVKSPEK